MENAFGAQQLPPVRSSDFPTSLPQDSLSEQRMLPQDHVLPFLGRLEETHCIFSDTEEQLRDGLASCSFYAAQGAYSIEALRSHAAGVVWLEDGFTAITSNVLESLSVAESQILLQIFALAPTSTPAPRIMEVLDRNFPCLALLRDQMNQDPWRAIAGCHLRVALAWLMACPAYLPAENLSPLQLRDRIAGIVWLCDAFRSGNWLSQIGAAPKARLLYYMGRPESEDNSQAPEIAAFVYFWSLRLAPFHPNMSTGLPEPLYQDPREPRDTAFNACQLVVLGEQASNSAVHALLAHEASVEALRRAQALEQDCSRSAIVSERAAENLANSIMVRLGNAGPPAAQDLSRKRPNAADFPSEARQACTISLRNLQGEYRPPAPEFQKIKLRPLQDHQRCALAHHIPFSASIVGQRLGSEVAKLVTCWGCGGKAHVKGECPTIWGKAGRPLPGFGLDGSQVESCWVGNDLSQRCLKSWEKFVARDHNFPEKALPARFNLAPDLGSFAALADLRAEDPIGLSLRDRLDARQTPPVRPGGNVKS